MTHVKKIECRRRSRKWCFTVNNYTDEDLDQISSLNTQYLIYGRERGEEGTDHIQGFAIFRNAVTFSSLKSKLPRAHIEITKGSTEENIRYCTKEDRQPFIRGTPPLERRRANVNAVEILERDPLNGPRILAANRIINGMHLESSMLSEIERGKLKKPKVIYVHGASGSGKTYYALQRGICDYGKENVCTIRFDRSGFAHCSNPLAKCLVLMEFRPSCLDAVTFLELTDGYGIHLNIKHGSIYIRPRCIIICSILPPSEIYKEEINRQFTRRLTEIVNKDLDPFIDRTEESESEGSTIELASDSDF